MNRFLVLTVIALSASFSLGAETPLSIIGNPIKFKENYTFVDNELVFSVINTSAKTYFFDQSESSCGCSKIRIEKGPILPKSILKGTIVHAPGPKTGSFANRFALVFKDEQGVKTTLMLEVSGDTKNLVILSPATIGISNELDKILFGIRKKFSFGEISQVTLRTPGYMLVCSDNFLKDDEEYLSYIIKWSDETVSMKIPESFEFSVLSSESKMFNFYVPVIDGIKKIIVCRDSPLILDLLERDESFLLNFVVNDQTLKIVQLVSVEIGGVSILDKCVFEADPSGEKIVKIEGGTIDKSKRYQEISLKFLTSDNKTITSRVHVILK